MLKNKNNNDEYINTTLDIVNDSFINESKISYKIAERALDIPFNLSGMVVRILEELPDGIVYNIDVDAFGVNVTDGSGKRTFRVIPDKDVVQSIRKVRTDLQKEIEFLKRGDAVEVFDIDINPHIANARELSESKWKGYEINLISLLRKRINK